MRLLGIETSTLRGSVALVEDDRAVGLLHHAEPSAHAERVLPLVERCLSAAGWSRASLDRIAVGVGPGSFVGLRVGIALAQGLGLGLGIPVIGVGSLRSLARVVPREQPGTRVAWLDARRDELFAAAYSAEGEELEPPGTIPRAEAAQFLARFGPTALAVGAVSEELDLGAGSRWSGDLGLPSAEHAAFLARTLDPARAEPVPLYCRGPGATLPVLPPSPFASGRD
jgi:tRNA threonylcarbamoyladenosine biosynthesis protein TsaB